MRAIKPVFILLISMSLQACAQYGDTEWPSLGFFDVPPEPEPSALDTAPAARPATLSVADLAALGDQFTDIQTRLEVQKASFMVAQARLAEDGEDRSWLTAQLELTRLGRLESELSSLLIALPDAARGGSVEEDKLSGEISEARARLRSELQSAGAKLGPRPAPAVQDEPSP